MSNPPKKQGTEEESRQVFRLQAEGYEAERLAEGSSKDIADIRFRHPILGDIYIESKARERFNIFKGMAKAKAKLVRANILAPHVLWWKQVILKDGNSRRSQVHAPLVTMHEDFFLLLLHLADPERRKPDAYS